jgi:hypothetical protein
VAVRDAHDLEALGPGEAAHRQLLVGVEREAAMGFAVDVATRHVRAHLDAAREAPPHEVAAGLPAAARAQGRGEVVLHARRQAREERVAEAVVASGHGSSVSGLGGARPRPDRAGRVESPTRGGPMPEQPETVFKFTAEGVDLEFAGSEEFVERQVNRFRAFLEQAVGAHAAVETAEEPAEEKQDTFADYAARRPIREGRGAIQDRILLAIYYMNVERAKREVAADDILWCFNSAGWERPKNLHNALGILKRKLGHLQEGSRRGFYQLSPKGVQYVEARFPPAD